MGAIYTDTNVLRYFRTAFAETSLQRDIRDHMVLAPLTVLELASQLVTGSAEEVFSAFKVLRPTHFIEGAGMWLLPWPDDLFRDLLSLPRGENTITPALTTLVHNVWNAQKVEDLKEDAAELRGLWDKTVRGLASVFSEDVDAARSSGPVPEEDRKESFFRNVAHRAGVDERKYYLDLLAKGLDAYWISYKYLLQVALQNENYNFDKNRNDHIDAELLIYLADPRLHLLTCDTGFRRVAGSSQANRVHIADPACLGDPERVTVELRNILRLDVAAA